MTENGKLDLIIEKLGALDNKVDKLDDKVNKLDDKVDKLDGRVSNLESDMQDVKQNIVKINVTLENEVRDGIMRVAEGHLDLSRNLHEAMKPNSEVEMLSIRVGMLETDMRELKSKIS